MAGKCKLYYFNITVLGDPVRWLLAIAGVPFEDIRIEKPDWPKIKPTLGWGKMPVLQFPDGREITQSGAIARYIAREYPALKLAGSNSFEEARCDQLVGVAQDCRQEWRTYFFTEDAGKKEELKAKLLGEVFPFYHAKFEEILKKNGGKWLIGSGVTYADLFLTVFMDLYEKTVDPAVFSAYPNMLAMRDAVKSIPQVQAWIAKSPPTAW